MHLGARPSWPQKAGKMPAVPGFLLAGEVLFQFPGDQLEKPIAGKLVSLLEPGLKVSGDLGNLLADRLNDCLPKDCGFGLPLSCRETNTYCPWRCVFTK